MADAFIQQQERAHRTAKRPPTTKGKCRWCRCVEVVQIIDADISAIQPSSKSSHPAILPCASVRIPPAPRREVRCTHTPVARRARSRRQCSMPIASCRERLYPCLNLFYLRHNLVELGSVHFKPADVRRCGEDLLDLQLYNGSWVAQLVHVP